MICYNIIMFMPNGSSEALKLASQHYDYIIVGAGSAGCVLANRLSKNPRHKILLLEAGAKDTHPFIHIPAGIAMLFNHPSLNWRYWTEPEPELKGRRIYQPRGKTLGGCSSIHGMAHTRGHHADYDGWAALGNNGWGWEDVLPYFKEVEAYAAGADAYRGDRGEMEANPTVPLVPIVDEFIRACASAGIPANRDYNGEHQAGASLVQRNILDNGRRLSCARAFLKPVAARPNLTVATKALTRRIVMANRRAAAVQYQKDDGSIHQASCSREILLSAGAINSPQLLQLSGIGPAGLLLPLGIDVVHHLPGVGENLQDHLWVPVKCRLKPGVASLNRTIKPWKYPVHLAKWLLHGKGLMTSTTSDVFTFVKSSQEQDRPDLQIAFRPSSFSYSEIHKPSPDPYDGITVTIYHVRPKSTGSVRITSGDPQTPPAIAPRYLSHADDIQALANGIHMARKIVGSHPIADKIASEVEPGPAIADEAALVDFIRDTAESVYHPVSTCKMGGDAKSVVDDRLKVHGVDGLRVVDASVMPHVVAGNTNIPTVMIAAKAADMIAEDNQ